jgi:hypothetical protein
MDSNFTLPAISSAGTAFFIGQVFNPFETSGQRVDRGRAVDENELLQPRRKNRRL